MPSTDVAVLDPIVTTAAVIGEDALLVFDTLYGRDAQFQPAIARRPTRS